MKILFAIQGTGNGHISRAKEIIKYLHQYGDLDILVSGTQSDISLGRSVDYCYYGMSYIFGKKGGIDLIKSIKKAKLFRFLKDLNKIPVENYDLIFNDFEPLTAYACKLKKVKSISLSHQAAFLSPLTPRPAEKSFIAEKILKYFAPTSESIGFHFQRYDHFIYTPIIRSPIREAKNQIVSNSQNKDYIAVYLPAWGDTELIKLFKTIKNVAWKVFSKHTSKSYDLDHISIRPISDKEWINTLVSAEGVLLGAGFESPAEVLFLNKPIFILPMSNQYEQKCNAMALENMGVWVAQKKTKYLQAQIQEWLKSKKTIVVDYPDQTAQIIDNIFANRGYKKTKYSQVTQKKNF